MKPNPPRIYPRIKPASFLDTVQPMLDRIEAEGGNREAQTPVAHRLAGDAGLLVTYAIDEPAQPVPLTQERMDELGLDAQELHELAVENLIRQAGSSIGAQDLVMYKALVAGNAFEASTLLLPGVWERLSEGFEGELLAVVPSRNTVYFMDSGAQRQLAGQQLTARTMLDLMCATAADIKVQAREHGLSDKVIALTPDGWQIRGTFQDHAAALGA
ncbi:hypothetical protein GNX71_30295 [Variovorax sp. RKNM96]|uniref:hypothetical protein n=1 Tax=Variovorax sp. RKNM96 TaxID=2681552 RepID=UPI00197FF707|nr:hypothetical protein [Variovorax sp. RKNM96]QSI33623.1 hypothetical protein GNX71_30295 [Variovorax sp. RKNM96]